MEWREFLRSFFDFEAETRAARERASRREALKEIEDVRHILEKCVARNDMRVAHRFGYWSACGPTNDDEIERCVRLEQDSWNDFVAQGKKDAGHASADRTAL